jgi:transposase
LDKACGIDVHRDTFVACIRDRDDNLVEACFETNGEGLGMLKQWIGENGCRSVAFESTGVYWRQLYNMLSSDFDVVVANPAKIKKPPASKFKKSDRVDAKWISTLRLSGMIPESRVFTGNDYDLRELTRFHEILVRSAGQFKNRAHRVLSAASVKIGSVLSDVFGLNGRKILDSIIDGKDIDDILAGIKNKRIKKKEEELRKALAIGLDETSRLLLKNCLYWIRLYEQAIMEVEKEMMRLLAGKEEELRIIMSIPGFGFVSSATILAEVGTASDFPDGDQMASWAGLVPSMFQSGDKKVYGRITKHGSKYLRRMLIQIAHVISKMDNNLSRFFHRIAEKKGPKKAASALARKLLTIIHHLLVNKEEYEEPTVKPKKVRLPEVIDNSPIPSIEEMIILIRETGRAVSDLPEPPAKKKRKKSRLSGSTQPPPI